jgi:hypothetical protein
MQHEPTNQQGGSTNDRNDSSGSGRVGSEMGSGPGREAVHRGRDGRRRGGSLHLGLRGVGEIANGNQLNYWKVLDEIREALVEINQTLKHR